MSGVVSIAVSVVQYAGMELLPRKWLAAFPSSPILWTVVGIVCIVLAAYLAWKDERLEVQRIERELAEERSAKNAPDLGLELSPEKHLHLVNRSHDKDVHNIVLRPIIGKDYELNTLPIPFLKRGVNIPFSVTCTQRGDSYAWDRGPFALELFPPDSLELQMPIFIEFSDWQGSVTYVA